MGSRKKKKLNMTKQNNLLTTNGESKHDILSMIDIGVPFLMLQKVSVRIQIGWNLARRKVFCLNPHHHHHHHIYLFTK